MTREFLMYVGIALGLAAVPAYGAPDKTVSITGPADYTGEGGLQAAFQDIEAAGTDGDGSTVTILDSGTYLGEIRVTNTNVTLQARAGESPAIRGGTNGPTGEATIRIGKKYYGPGVGGTLSIHGASQAYPIIIESEPPDKNCFTSTTGQSGVVVDCVEFRIAAEDESVWIPVQTGSNEAFTHCKWNMPGHGPLFVAGDGSNRPPTFTDCEFNAGGAPNFEYGRGALFTRCHIDAGGYLFQESEYHGAERVVTFDGCTFGSLADLSIVLKRGDTVVFKNCTLETATWTLARVTNGTLFLEDCLWTKGGIDSSPGDASPVTGVGANVVLNRTVVDFSRADGGPNPLINMTGAAADSDQPRRVTAANSMFIGAGTTATLMDMTMGNTTIPAEVTLTHCTFFGPTTSVLLAIPSQTATANYCIFDGLQTFSFAVIGDLWGVRNIVTKRNQYQGVPPGTLFDDPLLSPDGRLTLGSPAAGAATGSTATVDFEGDPRPLPVGSINDIGADESPLPDSDGDGLPDTWEIAHGLNPNSAVGNDGASGDPDADGATNLQEFQAGTDPQDSDSVPPPVPVAAAWALIAGAACIISLRSLYRLQPGIP